ncbi:MAG: HalD/BesD family halogenase [Dichotomicrobium sp.]
MSAAVEDLNENPLPLSDIVDLDRYPIDRLEEEAGIALIRTCRAQLRDDGCVVLQGFVRQDALARLEAETARLGPHAHYNSTVTNIYNSDGDDTLPDDHPVNVFNRRTNGFVAGDMIPDGTLVRSLYENEAFKSFVAAAIEEPVLYEYADPLAGLVVNCLRPGCEHPWHYDSNDFIVTMMTKAPDAGGTFEYCPKIRSAEDENIEGVSRVLRGDRTQVRALDLRPGDLQIFYGRLSLHRVARVEGARERHTLIFGYAREPGFIGRAARTRKLFGRIAPVHEREETEGLKRSDTLKD